MKFLLLQKHFQGQTPKSEKGFTLVEVIVVLFLVSFVLGAIVFSGFHTLRSQTFARNKGVAEKLVQKLMENARRVRDQHSFGWLVGRWNSSLKLCATDVNTTVSPWDFYDCPGSPPYTEIINNITYQKELRLTCVVSDGTCDGSGNDFFDVTATIKWTDQKGSQQTSLLSRFYKWQ